MDYNIKDLARIAIDCSKGNVEKYSVNEADETFTKVLKEAFGSEKLDLRVLRDNPKVFRIMETLIDEIAKETLESNPLFSMFTESVAVPHGDAVEFEVPDDTELIVSNTSRGNFGIRRQRIGENTSIQLKPQMHSIRVYDELYRILAGKMSTAQLVDKIGKAIERARLDDIYNVFTGLNGTSYNVYALGGSYTEDGLSDFIATIQAENNSDDVMIVTTKKVARKIDATDGSEAHKQDIYNNGYGTLWNGTKVLALPQRFKVGTKQFALKDVIYVVPVNQEKPIKQVIEGSTYMTIGDGSENVDQTIDIKAQLAFATGFISSGKFGVYTPTFA